MNQLNRPNAHRTNYVGLFDEPETFDDLLRGFLVRPVARSVQATTMPLKLDVREDDRAYLVQVDLPGVKKEDVDVQVDGNLVTINASIKHERDAKEGERILLSERYSGRLSRSFQLGHEINEADASARLNDGVLELRLPKKLANESRRKLSIQ